MRMKLWGGRWDGETVWLPPHAWLVLMDEADRGFYQRTSDQELEYTPCDVRTWLETVNTVQERLKT